MNIDSNGKFHVLFYISSSLSLDFRKYSSLGKSWTFLIIYSFALYLSFHRSYDVLPKILKHELVTKFFFFLYTVAMDFQFRCKMKNIPANTNIAMLFQFFFFYYANLESLCFSYIIKNYK